MPVPFGTYGVGRDGCGAVLRRAGAAVACGDFVGVTGTTSWRGCGARSGLGTATGRGAATAAAAAAAADGRTPWSPPDASVVTRTTAPVSAMPMRANRQSIAVGRVR